MSGKAASNRLRARLRSLKTHPVSAAPATRPVPVLPVLHLSHEPVPVCDGVDRHDLAKQSPEVLRIPAFGLSATPTEPLAVNMDETALNADRRPQAASQAEQVGVAVHRGAEGG